MRPETFGAGLCSAVALFASLWSGLALATADGPDAFRVRDVRADDVLHLSEAPSAIAKRVGQIPPDGRGIANLGCVQTRNGRVMPDTDMKVGALWCRVRYRGQEGWASGRFLAEDAETAAPAKAGYPAEVARAVREARDGCKAFGAGPGFARSDLDLNGDGVKDWVLDHRHVECDGGSSMFCGNAGCLFEVFLSTPGGGFAKAYGSNVREYEFLPGHPATIRHELHGSACGRIGAEECRRFLRAKGTTFVPDGR